MSKLSKLQGKSKTYTIGEIELELKPLTLEEMSLIEVDENSSQEQQMIQTNKLLSTVLKKAVPDATDEEIKQLGAKNIGQIMKAIMDVNGLNKQKKGMKDVIAERRQALKNKEKASGTE